MNKKLKKLKEAIISAVPEIMEVRFGTKFFWDAGTDEEFIGDWIIIKIDEDEIGAIKCKGRYIGDSFGLFSKEEIKNNKDFKILGRPITLEDVLITLTKKFTFPIVMQDNGNMLISEEDKKLLNLWQLNKPLDQQPKEVIDFLYNILCQGE